MKGFRIYSSARDKKSIITLFFFFFFFLTVSIQALSARSRKEDAGDKENLEEKMKEIINDIKKLVQKKKLGKKNKKKVLNLLEQLSAKAEGCGDRLRVHLFMPIDISNGRCEDLSGV